jgi:hypothetical protein
MITPNVEKRLKNACMTSTSYRLTFLTLG